MPCETEGIRTGRTLDPTPKSKGEKIMSVRSYWLVCGVFVLASILLFATGNMTMMVSLVLGFLAFGLTFMGMMNVLPTTVSHVPHPKPVKKVETMAIQPMRETPANAFHVLKSA